MARYVGPKCRLCRREGVKLFLKGDRCYSDKCSFERRAYAPGQHGSSQRRKESNYGLQLREKQKAKRIYGILERQFKRYFEEAARRKGATGETLLQILESRLDNLVYRFGFAPSRQAARQLVKHGHITVNGEVVDIPSYRVSPGDVIRVREESKGLELIHESLRKMGRGRDLPWLSVDKTTLSGTMLELPKREDIPIPIEEHLIVELYSK